MGERFSGPHRKIGDAHASPALRDVAKKLIGEMKNQQRLSGVSTQVRRLTMPDGSGVVARLVNGEPQVQFYPPGALPEGELEEIIYLYISSAGGLRIFDLGTKTLVKTVTGLHPYEVDSVSEDGKIVHMTSGNGGAVVRVDVSELTAFGFFNYPAYWWDTTLDPDNYSLGLSLPAESKASPDGTQLLISYDRVGLVSGPSFLTKEALGGFELADATTLVPLRPSIRMSAGPQVSAWAPDSQRFYLSTKATVDGNGFPPAPPNDLSLVRSDYVSVFSRAGALLGSRQVGTFTSDPLDGQYTLTEWLEPRPDNTRLYVAAVTEVFEPLGPGVRFTTLDTTDNTLPIVSAVHIPGIGRSSCQSSLSHSGKTLMTAAGGVTPAIIETIVKDGEDDTMELVAVHESPNFATTAANSGGDGEFTYRVLQKGPKSRVGQPPDNRWFFLTKNGSTPATLFAYRDFANDPVYQLDLSAYAVHKRYALASVGVRPKRKAA